MNAKPWSVFAKVKRALDEEDIEGLLAVGAPQDKEREAEALEWCEALIADVYVSDSEDPRRD